MFYKRYGEAAGLDLAHPERATDRQKKAPFAFTRERRSLRYVVLLLAGLSLLSGYTLLLELTEPYSIFGRILNDLFAVPVSYGWNGLVDIS